MHEGRSLRIGVSVSVVSTLTLLAGSTLAQPAIAVGPTSQPAVRSGTQPASTQPAPIIHVANIEHDFGDVWAGPDQQFAFEIFNRGKSTLKITGVQPQCGCTTAGAYPNTIEPGQSGKFPFVLHTTAMRGPQAKAITVLSNDPVTPSLQLRLRGNFKRRIDLSPPGAYFGPIIGDKPVVRNIKITNNTDTPLQLSLKPLNSDRFKFELSETVPGKEFLLRVSSVPPHKPGEHNVTAILQTSLPEEKEISVSASGRVPDRLDLYPYSVRYSKPVNPVAGRDYTSLYFWFNNYGAKLIKLKEASVNDSAITTLVQMNSEGKNWRIEVRVPHSVTVPPEGRVLTIKTDDEEKPELTAKIIGVPQLRDTIKTSNMGSPQAAKRPAEYLVGQPAPAFELKTLDGVGASPADLAGTVAVLNYVSPICPWCKKQIPLVEAIRPRYQDQGVRFINVVNPNPTGHKEFSGDEIKQIMTSLNAQLEVASDTGAKVQSALRVTSFPTMVVLGKDGKVAAVNIGAGKVSMLPAQLDALLAGKPVPTSQPK